MREDCFNWDAFLETLKKTVAVEIYWMFSLITNLSRSPYYLGGQDPFFLIEPFNILLI